MPIYATTQDAIDLYGADYVTVASDHDQDGIADLASLDKAWEHASADMEGYLRRADRAAEIPTTSADAPGWWKIACIDLGLAIVSPSGVREQDVKEKRAKHWRDLFEDQYPLVTTGGTPVATPTGSVRFSEHAREYTATKQVGL